MRHTHLRRPLTTVTTAIICVIALASPAAAVPVTYKAVLTAGVITLTKTGITPEVIDLAPPNPSCIPADYRVTFTSNTNSSNVSITNVAGLHAVTFAGGTYLTQLTRSTFGNTQGHVTDSTTGTHTITATRVALIATIYNTTDCTPTGTPVCTLAALLELQGTTTSISTSSNFTLTGSSVTPVVAFPTCAAGPSYLVGTTSTVTTAITGHFSSVP